MPSYSYGDVKLGHGNFDLAPVLIGTMFYQGQTLLERGNEIIFDSRKAKKRIDMHNDLKKKYKLPGLIEISGTTPEAMIKYLEFYLEHYDPPFVLGGTFDARTAGMRFLKEQGFKPSDYIYNTISNLKNKKELEVIKEHGVESVVILILGSENMTASQRYAYIANKNQPGGVSLIDGLKKLGVERIWVDGGVINLESLAHILETQRMISTSLNLPVGTAPNLFLFKFSSPRLNIKFHTRYRRANIMFAAAWYSNFIFYGPVEDAKECFAATAQTMEFKKIVTENKIKLFE